MKKLLTLITLFVVTPAFAFIPSRSLDSEILVSETFLIVTDKNGNEWKVDTTCDNIKLDKNMKIITSSHRLSNARLRIEGKNKTQHCRVTKLTEM